MRLLILSCSARKKHNPELLPALDRYDGPAFHVVRKALAAGAVSTETTAIRILSARYGLIFSTALLPDYDQRMTFARAVELRPGVTSELFALLQNQPITSVFINAGRAYALALAEFAPWCRLHDITCTEATGGIGQRLAQLKAWLYA